MASFVAVAWLCLVLLLGVREGDARSSGAPTMACSTLTPNHGASSQPIPGGYFIYSSLIDSGGGYTSGTTYTRESELLTTRINFKELHVLSIFSSVTLQGGSDFKGFLIQAVESGTSTLIGSFGTPTGVQHLNCGNPTAATVSDLIVNYSQLFSVLIILSKVTHTNANPKSSIVVTWTAPSNTGTVKF